VEFPMYCILLRTCSAAFLRPTLSNPRRVFTEAGEVHCLRLCWIDRSEFRRLADELVYLARHLHLLRRQIHLGRLRRESNHVFTTRNSRSRRY